ncbi:MAG: hypothetical protein ACSLFN_15445 [Candidatus Limnocylindrales bacterium]
MILETTLGIVEIGMPAGEGVSAGGWDGAVRATAATAWVPTGLSLWEVSVDAGTGRKSDYDYSKRDSTPDASSTSDCTYIELILRPWTKRAEWATSRTAERKWADVRAYGVDDVEAWLESAPVTWAWISEELGLHPFGMRTAERWWETWSAQCAPVTTPGLVLAGRANGRKAMSEFLDGPPGIVTVAGPSTEEVCAFVVADAVDQMEAGHGQRLARMVFVDDVTAWRSLVDTRAPLVLIPLDPTFATDLPRASPHHVFVPVTTASRAQLILEPLDATEATAALVASGLDEPLAAEAGRLARRSLTALRRRLAVNPALHSPPWSTPPVARAVRSVVLAGSWSDRGDGDRKILAGLAGEEYERIREAVAFLALAQDPLVSLVDDAWHLVSPLDAWLSLRDHVTPDDLGRLGSAVDQVFGEEDPALELPEEERWLAGVRGKVRAYSKDLRHGLARSLALLATNGAQIRAARGLHGSNLVEQLVSNLLQRALEDQSGDRLAGLSDVLPLLAEAGPDAFLAMISSALNGETPIAVTMFREGGSENIFGPSSPHTGLLWALENLAWSPDHFGATVEALARLDEVDPGGRLSNRPLQSLIAIFFPLHPENAATSERRLIVIDAMRQRHPETAWKVMTSLLPELHFVHLPTHEPEHRDWKPPRAAVTYVEYYAFVHEVLERCAEDAGPQAYRWITLIERSPDLPPPDRELLLARLTHAVSDGRFDKDGLDRIWLALRDLVGRHRQFAQANWALPEAQLLPIDTLVARLNPDGAFQRSAWLFRDWSPALEGTNLLEDHEAYETELRTRRRDAVRAIVDEGGFEAVRRLALEAEVGWSVGIASAQATGDTYNEELLQILDGAETAEIDLAGNHFAQRFRDAGWDWLNGLIEQHTELTDLTRTRLLLAARDFPAAWEAAEAAGPQVANQYWKNFVVLGLGRDFAYVEVVAQRLMNVGRHARAVDFLVMYTHRPDSGTITSVELLAKALEGLLANVDPEIRTLQQHHFTFAIEVLERHVETIGAARLAGIEWAFLPALGHEPIVPTLYNAMAIDPAFYVDVVSTVYRSTAPHEAPKATADDSSEFDNAVAGNVGNSYRLLTSWNMPPGLVEGRVDPTRLRTWLEQATPLLRERRCYEAGLMHLGGALVMTPDDEDGAWPALEVRDFIDELRSDDLEAGLRAGLINRRGVTVRGPGDGGVQERELASRYQVDADRFSDGWPRTAAVLRSLAKALGIEGRYNDESAERFRQGLE